MISTHTRLSVLGPALAYGVSYMTVEKTDGKAVVLTGASACFQPNCCLITVDPELTPPDLLLNEAGVGHCRTMFQVLPSGCAVCERGHDHTFDPLDSMRCTVSDYELPDGIFL